MAKLVPLGINGFIPTHGRHTACYLVLMKKSAFMLDAGTGVSRIFQDDIKKILSGYKKINILLSHYHIDHIVGLTYLTALWPGCSVDIYAPSSPFVEVSAKEALSRLLSPPLFPVLLESFPIDIKLCGITENRLIIEGVEIKIKPQNHPGGSAGFRIVDDIVYLSDTSIDMNAAHFIEGAKILLHEVWFTDEEAHKYKQKFLTSGHTCSSEAARLAEKAKIPKLMPIHHHPYRPSEQVNAFKTLLKRNGTEIIVPEECRIYEL